MTCTCRLGPPTPLQTQWGVLVRFKACIVPDQPTCLAHSPVSLLTPLHFEDYRKMAKDKKRKRERKWTLERWSKEKEGGMGGWRARKKRAETLHICLGTMSEPAFESVGLKEEADLAVNAVKWFSGLTVADATDSAAPLGACTVSQAWLLSKYTYCLPLQQK